MQVSDERVRAKKEGWGLAIETGKDMSCQLQPWFQHHQAFAGHRLAA